jgi:hypothetical protein
VTEWQILRYSVSIRRIDHHAAAQLPATFGTLCGQQMSFAGVGSHHFPGRRDLKSFGNGFAGLYTFWTAHNQSVILPKRARNIGASPESSKRFFAHGLFQFSSFSVRLNGDFSQAEQILSLEPPRGSDVNSVTSCLKQLPNLG